MSELEQTYINETVFLETDRDTVYIGTLTRIDAEVYQLDNLAIYSKAISQVSLEEFLIECAKYEIPVSRKQTLIRRQRVIAISLLSGVIIP
ncbi:MAG: hypothetical protein HRT89_07390 [Lentisphaeria bacterium]|nr:hypothetical protein [Lentisphaeria bacterium]NQZ67878.1 hypothetical protein [Lentisphaeria bacterium]